MIETDQCGAPVGATCDTACDAGESRRALACFRLVERLSVRSLLAIWALLSIGWGCAVGYNIYRQAETQADMSRAVERDLEQPLIAASCGPSCTGDPAHDPADWPEIASTYLRFGKKEIGEFAFGPPLAVLAAGLAASLALKSRRRLRRRPPE